MLLQARNLLVIFLEGSAVCFYFPFIQVMLGQANFFLLSYVGFVKPGFDEINLIKSVRDLPVHVIFLRTCVTLTSRLTKKY